MLRTATFTIYHVPIRSEPRPQIHVEFRPEAFDGILLLSGERDDLTGDFVALLIHQGFVEFW